MVKLVYQDHLERTENQDPLGHLDKLVNEENQDMQVPVVMKVLAVLLVQLERTVLMVSPELVVHQDLQV